MGWRRKRTWDRQQREEGPAAPRGRAPAPPDVGLCAGPADLDLLRDPLRPGLANAGRYASLLRAGQQTMGNAALQALLGRALGGPGEEVEVALPQEEGLPGEVESPVEAVDVERENEIPGEGAAGGPAPAAKAPPAAPAAAKAKTYDMGKAIANAAETSYTIKQPKMAKLAGHFKFLIQGKRYAAMTSWKVRIDKWLPVKKEGELVVDPLPLKIESITVELPKWQDFDKASEPEKEAWAKFIKAVRVHEQGHVDRVRNYMEKNLPEDLKSIRGSTMKELSAENKRVLQEVTKALRDDADAYDVDTNHGATQGAVLKPPAAAKPAAGAAKPAAK